MEATIASDFVSLTTLRERFGVDRSTLRRRLRRAGLITYIDPSDERSRLLKREDAEALLRPRPSSRKKEAA